MTLWALLRWGVLAGATAPLIYYVFAIDTARRFFAHRPAAPGGFTPPVSVLKPVRGLDRETYENFASFCRQDYPDCELLFAVSDRDDPAVPIVRKLIDDFPGQHIRLLVGADQLGPNDKVNKLCRLVREARHDLLVMSDSDIRVTAGYLRAVVAPFRDPRVGAVTCLYTGLSDGRLASDLEALTMASDFAAGVLVASRLEGVRFTLGATMATTRARLAAIGGFEALVDYCADDFELGQRIAAGGYRVELVPQPVRSECSAETLGGLFTHQLRWAVTIRHSRPGGHAGLVVTHGLAWSLAAAALAPSAGVAAAWLGAYLTLRLAMVWTVAVRGMEDAAARRTWWLVPVRDAIGFAVWVASLFCNRIVWRGRRFDLRKGRLVPAGAGRSLSAGQP